MTPNSPDHLSEIQTVWEVLYEARQEAASTPAVCTARDKLVAVYQRAVFGYLCGCVRDPEIARDLAQQFWLRFFQGKFDQATPEKGRFRSYLKVALSHMATHAAQGQLAEGSLPTDVPDATADDWTEFDDCCRRGYLNDAWGRLASDDTVGHGQYAALRLKADFPNRPDHELANLLAERTGHAVSHDGYRKLLERARSRFAEAVYRTVAESLRDPTPDRVAEELGEVGLLRYCRSALAKRTGSG